MHVLCFSIQSSGSLPCWVWRPCLLGSGSIYRPRKEGAWRGTWSSGTEQQQGRGQGSRDQRRLLLQATAVPR